MRVWEGEGRESRLESAERWGEPQPCQKVEPSVFMFFSSSPSHLFHYHDDDYHHLLVRSPSLSSRLAAAFALHLLLFLVIVFFPVGAFANLLTPLPPLMYGYWTQLHFVMCPKQFFYSWAQQQKYFHRQHSHIRLSL